MITSEELDLLYMCFEWFLYGKIFFLCALTCTLLKKVFSGLGIYSGIFAIYIQCPSKESRTQEYFFFLSVIQLHLRTLPVQLQSDSQPLLFRIKIVQTTTNGCCDFIAQCTLVRINHCTYHPFYSPKSPLSS